MTRLLLPALFAAFAAVSLAADKPNVLVIVADDLGYADVGFQGAKDIPTPNLDTLAKESVRCTNGYVSHPFCSPTRAGLMTGRYQQHFGHENNPVWNPEDTKSGLPLNQVTLPQLMKKAGYVTGAVGKWHLGAHPQFHPNQRGFDDYFGFRGGGHLYLEGTKGGAEYNIPLEFNGQERPFDDYLTNILGREAAGFIERHQGKNWLLYLAFNAPHTPLSAPPELLAKFAGIADEGRRTYAAMENALDTAVGSVLARLDATKQRENTLIFFISDNGGPDLSGKSGKPCFTDNSPLRGHKGQVYDGGIRVPFLVSWPAKLKPGTYDKPVISLDFLPTALAAASAVGVPSLGGHAAQSSGLASADATAKTKGAHGASEPPKGGTPTQTPTLDGVNLIPFLSGEKTGTPHETLFWRANGPGGNYAARMDDWKLVRLGKSAPELYNLASDIGETKNLAVDKLGVLAKLLSAVETWDKDNIAPVFGGPQEIKKQGKAKAKK